MIWRVRHVTYECSSAASVDCFAPFNGDVTGTGFRLQKGLVQWRVGMSGCGSKPGLHSHWKQQAQLHSQEHPFWLPQLLINLLVKMNTFIMSIEYEYYGIIKDGKHWRHCCSHTFYSNIKLFCLSSKGCYWTECMERGAVFCLPLDQHTVRG